MQAEVVTRSDTFPPRFRWSPLAASRNKVLVSRLRDAATTYDEMLADQD
jgi:hypothetical protein